MFHSEAALVYAEQLRSHGHGEPLWQPEPTQYGEVLIGDVGFAQEGRFFRLFNVLRPADDPANARGVPSNFSPLEINSAFLVDTVPSFLPPGPVYNNKTTNCKAGAGASAYVQNVSWYCETSLTNRC